MNPQRSWLHLFLAWAATLAYMGLIFYCSSLSILPIPMRFLYQDKLMHGAAYFILACLLSHSISNGGLKRRFLLAFLIASLYGISDEFHQHFVPGRDVSVWDWLADSVGAWVGAFLYLRTEYSLNRWKLPKK
jgi:VanZ family protein